MTPDDPDLTAYALDELDPKGRRRVEAALAEDPILQDELTAIRTTIADLSTALPRHDGPGLRDDQRRVVQHRAARQRPGKRWSTPWIAAATAAALLFLTIGLWGPHFITRQVPERAAHDTKGDGTEPVTVVSRSKKISPDENGNHKSPIFFSQPAFEDSEILEHVEKHTERKHAHRTHAVTRGIQGRAGTQGGWGGTKTSANEPALLPGNPTPPEGADLDRSRAMNTEAYDRVADNPFRRTADPGYDTSTFSIDVDTASYANVRRLLKLGRRPPPGAVRIEEMVNYFPYRTATPPSGDTGPFAMHAEVAPCPWHDEHLLARLTLKGREIAAVQRPALNLVFLIDVSGSMGSPDKLPLLIDSLRGLTQQLDRRDSVAIVVYAGSTGVVLPPTDGGQKPRILAALAGLRSGGSTNGGAGIQRAYDLAREHFVDGCNRVILATDGDFNVGISDRSRLVELIEEQARSGIDLTVLGFGSGNLKDATMEELSNKGNGNYHYIDSRREAHKVLIDELTGSLVTIAKDVKIQVYFNPAAIAGWRLIGYENRRLAREDFNDDRVDAGEVGAGHTVTALYQLVPAGTSVPSPAVDQNPFVKPARAKAEAMDSGMLMRLRLRYKEPEADTSKLQEFDVGHTTHNWRSTTGDFRWAAAVAGYGMLLRDSPHAGRLTWDMVGQLAMDAYGGEPDHLHREFHDLVSHAERLSDTADDSDMSDRLPMPDTLLEPRR